MCPVPGPHPKEFRDDVVAIDRQGEAPIQQVAGDLGISVSRLRNWLHQADAILSSQSQTSPLKPHRRFTPSPSPAMEYAVTGRTVEGRAVAGCIVHSDRGSQFRSRRLLAAPRRYDLGGSMGRAAFAGDNATIESFFALLQKNVLNRRRWTTRKDLRIAIITWIERAYHLRRRQARLGRLTPHRA